MLHKIFRMNRLDKLCVVTLLGVLGAFPLAHAGDPIVVGGEKSKAAPAPEGKTSAREVFRLREPGSPASAFDVLSIPMSPEKKRLDPREEKRRRLQDLEKKNWMLVDKGELQAEEDEKNFLNVREYSLDGLEKQDDRENLLFRPLSKDDNRRMPGQFRDNPRQSGQRAAATSEEPEGPGSNRSEKDPELGAHLSSELSFRQLFQSREGGSDSLAPKFNKSDLSLHSLLNAGGNTESTREQQARRKDFQNFLNKPATPLAGPSDPINGRSDSTRQPLNPTTPQPFGGESPARFGGTTLGAGPAMNRPNSGFSPGSPFNSPRPAAGSSPFLTPQDSFRGPQKPINLDPPKRKF
jgi:hypothetical protein